MLQKVERAANIARVRPVCRAAEKRVGARMVRAARSWCIAAPAAQTRVIATKGRASIIEFPNRARQTFTLPDTTSTLHNTAAYRIPAAFFTTAAAGMGKSACQVFLE